MKLYTVLPNQITKLKPIDIYRLACLSFTPRKKVESGYADYTDSTFKQIAEVSGDKLDKTEKTSHTIRSFVDRLKAASIIKIESGFVAGDRRNHYHFPELKENFTMIKNSLINLDIDKTAKGFFIGLSTLVYGTTNWIGFNNKEIAKELNMGESTVRKYIKILLEAELIQKVNKGIELSLEYLKINSAETKEEELKIVDKIITEIKTIDPTYLQTNKKLEETNWNKIKHPIAYFKSHLNGTLYITNKYKKDIIEEIKI